MANDKWDKFQVEPGSSQVTTSQTPSQDKWTQFQVDTNPAAVTPPVNTQPVKEEPGFFESAWNFIVDNPRGTIHTAVQWAKDFSGFFKDRATTPSEIDKKTDELVNHKDASPDPDLSATGQIKASDELQGAVKKFVDLTQQGKQQGLMGLSQSGALYGTQQDTKIEAEDLLKGLKYNNQPTTYKTADGKFVTDVNILTQQPAKVAPEEIPAHLESLEALTAKLKSQYDSQMSFIAKKYDDMDKQAQGDSDNYEPGFMGNPIGPYNTPNNIKAGRIDDMKALNESYEKIKDLVRQQKTRLENSLDEPLYNPLSQINFNDKNSIKAIPAVLDASTQYFKEKSTQAPTDMRRNAAMAGADVFYVDQPHQREMTKLAMRTKPELSGMTGKFKYEPWNEQFFAYSKLREEQGRVQMQMKQDQDYLDGLNKTFKEGVAADAQKGRQLTPQGKEQLNQLGDLIAKYQENIDAKGNYLKTIDNTIKTQTKDFSEYVATQDKLNRLYDESAPLSVSTGQLLRHFTWQLPRNIDNWVQDFRLKHDIGPDIKLYGKEGQAFIISDPDEHQKELASMALTSDKLAELQPQKLAYNPNWNVGDPAEQAKIRQNLSQVGAVQVFDNKGNFSPQIDMTGLYYQSVKVGAESVILGFGGLAAEEVITKKILGGQLASKFGVNLAERELAGGFFEKGIKDEALKDYYRAQGVPEYLLHNVAGSTLLERGAYGALEGSNWLAVTTIGMGIPSMAMFGSDITKGELTKGDLTWREASDVANVRAFWEGLTERIGFDQVNMVRGMIGKGTIRTLTQLGENEIYQSAIANTVEKLTGKAYNPKLVAALFGVEVLAKEGGEEVASDFLNHLTDYYESNKHHGQYRQDNPFDMANEVNTMVSTMATMLFTGGKAGMQHFQENKNGQEPPIAQQLAQYIVAQNPATYLNAINGQLITSDNSRKLPTFEAARRTSLVNKYTEVYNSLNFADIDAKPISEAEKEAQKFIRFQNTLKTVDLTEALALHPNDDVKRDEILAQLEDVKSPAPENPNIYPLIEALKKDRGEWLKAQTAAEQAKVEQTSPEVATQNNAKGVVPVTHADGTTTDLEIGKEYHLNSFNYRSDKGNLLKYTPLMTVLSDNGPDVTVQFGGEVVTLPKEDLGQYKFLPKETVDQWRKEKDVRALILDNYNNAFSYKFSGETKERVKAPTGRVRWDSKENKAFFVYNDKAGKQRQQELTSEDFKKKLTLVKKLEATQTDADFERQRADFEQRKQQAEYAKLEAQKAKRTQVFDAFMAEESKKATKLYDQSIKKLNKAIKGTRDLIQQMKELRKKPILDISDLVKFLPKDMVRALVKTKGIASDNQGMVLIQTPQGPKLVELKDSGVKFSRFEILTAINQELARLQAAEIDPIDAQIKMLEEQRQKALDNLGLDYNEYLTAEYDSDISLTQQVKEYRDALKERLKQNTELIDKLKGVVGRIRDIMTGLSNEIANLIPKFASIVYDPTASQEEEPDLKEQLEKLGQEVASAEARIAQAEKENEGLPAEVEKLTKLVKFLSRKEASYTAARQKVKLEKASETIFKSQMSSQSNSETNPPEEDQVEADKAMAESAKIELRNLFNATTSSSPVGADGTLLDHAVARLQHFLNTIKDPEAHSLLLITKDNAEQFGLSGIIFTGKEITNKTDNQADNDIRMVVIRPKGDNEFDFVDKDGNVIDRANITADNVVYSAMRLAELNWSDGQLNYVIKGAGGLEVTEFAEALRKNHADFRQQIVELTKAGRNLTLPITGVSRGHVNLTGEHTSAVGNIIPAGVDLATTQVIQIPLRTSEQSITEGVTFQGLHSLVPMPTGRPVLSYGQNLAFLNNKRFTKQDVGKFMKLFKLLYEEAKRTGELDKDIVKYLSNVLYWRNPTKLSQKTDKSQVGETIGRGQVWYDAVSRRLFLGNQDQSIPFSFEANDQAGFTMLQAFLEGVYHNVNAKDLVGVPFTEIVDVTKKGKIVTIEWPSYQAYLLENKYPDGTPRAAEDTPLKTVIQPSQEGIPNMRGRYMTYENKSNDDAVSAAGYTVTTVPGEKGELKVSPQINPEETVKDGKPWTKNSTNDLTKIDRDPGNEYEIRSVADDGSVQTVRFTFGKNGGSFVLGHNVMDQFGKPRDNREVKGALDRLLEGQSKNSRATVFVRARVEEDKTKNFIPAGDVQKTDDQAKNLPFSGTFVPTQQPPTTKGKGNFVPTEDKGDTTVAGDFKPAEDQAKKGPITKDFLKALKDKAAQTKQEEDDYRVATKRNYELENLSEARRWFEERFPKSIAFRTLVGLIDGKAWGVVRDAAVTISNLAEVGTVYHEAFEVVHKYFLNPAQLFAIRGEFRRRKGTFIEYGTGKTIKYSQATNAQVKEQLAEEFREAQLTGEPAFKGQVETASWFRRMLDFIYNFVLNTSPETIQEIFDKIQTAKYKDAVPNLNTTNLNGNYRIDQVKQEHAAFYHDVMRSMTNLMFSNLAKQNIAIPEFLLTQFNTADIYDDIKKKVDTFYGGAFIAEMIKTYTEDGFVKEFTNPENYDALISNLSPSMLKSLARFATSHKLTDTEALQKLYDVLKNYAFIEDNWNDFVKEHKLYLGKYQIEFSEDADTKETDEENENFREYGRDVLKLSRKLNANTEVKLLIATLREMEIPASQTDKFGFTTGSVQAQPKLNSLLMSQLVDYNRVIISLLYKMAPTTSFDEVAGVLKKMVDTNPSLAPLVTKLKLDSPISELTAYDVDLRNKFYTSLSNMIAEYHKFLLNPEDLAGADVNLNELRAVGLIKEKWLNNLKLNTHLVKIEKGLYKIKTEALPVKSIADEKDAVKFLRSIGVDIPFALNRLTRDERATFLNASRDLLKILYSADPDAILSDNATTRAPLSALAEIYVDKTDSYAEPQHTNVEGESVQNILLHNSIGIIMKHFNASISLDDFFRRLPQLNPDNAGNGFLYGSQILKRGGQFFDDLGNKRRSISLNLLDGSQVRDTEVGTPTASLNFVDRVAQEFASNLAGVYYSLVPGDTKSEWGFGIGPLVTKQQAANDEYILPIFKGYLKAEILAVQDFLNDITSKDINLNNRAESKKIGAQLRTFKGILRSVDPDFNLHISKDKTADEIIADNEEYINQAILKYINDDVEDTIRFFAHENIITKYRAVPDQPPASGGFVPTGSNTATGFVPDSAEDEGEYTGKYTIAFAPKEHTTGGLTQEEVFDLVKFANINYIMGIIEQHKLIWGDPGMWKDMAKRTKSFTSGRMLSIADAPYFNQWHNKNSNMLSFVDDQGNIQNVELTEGDFGYWVYDDTIRTQTMKDVKVHSSSFEEVKAAVENQTAQDLYDKQYSELDKDEKKAVDKILESKELKSYETMEEADAQSWATFSGYREIRQRANTWGEAEEELYQWDTALARWEISNGKDYVTGKSIGLKKDLYPQGAKGELLRKYDEAVLRQGNPTLNRSKDGRDVAAINILKPIQAGLKMTTNMVNNLDKTSTMAVTWRIAKGRNLASWYLTHMGELTTYVKVASANKIGNTTDQMPMYDINTGKPNLEVNHQLLPFRTYGIQVETITQKRYATLGTQMTKQSTMNLSNGGVPLDYIKANRGKTIRDIKTQWDALGHTQQIEASKFFKLSYDNNLYLGALKDLAKDEIFKEFGITEKEIDGVKSFEFTNLQKFERLIQRELNLRNAPENIKEFARLTPTINPETGAEEMRFALPFDLMVGSEKLESLLTAVVDKQVLRPKMFGGQFPQVSSAMFESGARGMVLKNAEGNWEKVSDPASLTPEQRNEVLFTSNELKFYKMDKDGKQVEACEIMVPFFFQEFINQGQELDISSIPKELLEGVGFRIPTQGVNAMEFFVIKGFLPVEYGNSVVVPSEIVAKTGSDFDIDKLNIYLHNYVVKYNKEGKATGLEKVKYLDDTNSTTHERYIKAVNARIKEADKEVRGRYKEEKEDLFKQYKEGLEELYQEEVTPVKEVLDELRKQVEDGMNLAQATYSQGYKLFRALPKEIKQEFWDLNDELEASIGAGEVEAFEKTLFFRSLANSIIKKSDNQMAVGVLEALVANYDLYLAESGITKEFRDKFSASLENYQGGLLEFRDNKPAFREHLAAERFLLSKNISAELGWPSFEEFEKSPLHKQNSKEALENAYIDAVRAILSLPENFAQLTEPNSAKVIKDEAEKINRLYQKPSQSKVLTHFISRLRNAETRHSFLVGKGGVGIGAASQSQHAVAQIVGLPFTEALEVEGKKPFSFPANSELSEDGRVITYNLSEVYAKDGRTISSVISAFINALVDVNKDPFIIDINGNLGTLGAYLTAVRMGIPIGLVVRWFNQPVIREYVKTVDREKSILSRASRGEGEALRKKAIVRQVISQFQATAVVGNIDNQGDIDIPPRASDFNEEELDGYIKQFVQQQKTESPKYTQEFADAQAILLDEFIKLEALQWKMFDFGQALVDTARSVTLDGIRLKNARIMKALNGPFAEAVNRVFARTFQGNILVAKNEFLQSLRPLYVTESTMARAVLSPILNQLFNSKLKNVVKEKETKEIRKAFITYLIHTIPISIGGGETQLLTDFIKDLFTGKDNITRMVRAAQEAQQDSDQPNFFLKNLLATATNKAKIRLLRKSSDKFDQDLLTSEFLNLRNTNPELVRNLIKAAMLQSGVHLTPTSFQEIIPNALFSEISNQVLEFLHNPNNNIPELLSYFQNSYYENNWKNRNIVPKAQTKSSTGTPRLEDDIAIKRLREAEEMGREGGYTPWLPGSGINFLQFYVDSTRPKSMGPRPAQQAQIKYLLVQRVMRDEFGDLVYSKREMEEMKNRGDWSFLEQTLYKRLEVLNDAGELDAPVFRRNYSDKMEGQWKSTEIRYVLFYPVNKKGDGIDLVEHYNKPHTSAIHSPVQRAVDQQLFQALMAQENGYGQNKHNSVSGLFLNQHYIPQSGQSNYSLSLRLLTDPELGTGNYVEGDIDPYLRTIALFDTEAADKERAEKSKGDSEEDPFKCKT